MIWLQWMSCLCQTDAWVTLFCHVKGTLVIFRIWLINQPHFHLLPKGERVAVILLTAHTAPYVRSRTPAKLGEKGKRKVKLPFSLTVFVFSSMKSFRNCFHGQSGHPLKQSPKIQPMTGADLCVYGGFKSNQAFQGFVLLTYKTIAVFGTEILKLPKSVSSLLTNLQICWNLCLLHIDLCYNVPQFYLLFQKDKMWFCMTAPCAFATVAASLRKIL